MAEGSSIPASRWKINITWQTGRESPGLSPCECSPHNGHNTSPAYQRRSSLPYRRGSSVAHLDASASPFQDKPDYSLSFSSNDSSRNSVMASAVDFTYRPPPARHRFQCWQGRLTSRNHWWRSLPGTAAPGQLVLNLTEEVPPPRIETLLGQWRSDR